jgi:predicted transcriptional regulator
MEQNNFYKQFILGKSFFRCHHRVNHEITNQIPPDQLEQMVKEEITQNLAKEIYSQLKEEITINKNNPDFDEYNFEVFVIKQKDLKDVVEAVIEILPQNKIDKIKNGK